MAATFFLERMALDLRRPLRILLLCLLLSPSPSSNAGDDPPKEPQEAYRMKDTVVTADKIADETMEAPAGTTVITRLQIEQSPATELDDLLKHTVGMQLWQPWGPFGPDSKLTMRGFSQSRATVLLKDGMPVNRVLCGGAKTNEFPLEMIERIMIGRGMNASAMGTSAMAGVINIEGKTPGDKTQGHVKGAYGTYNTWSGDAFLSARLTPQWGLLAAYHHFDTDGYHSWSDEWVASKTEEWSQLDQRGQNTIANFNSAIADEKQTRTTDSATGRLVFTPSAASGKTAISLDASYWDNAVHNSMLFNDNYQERLRMALTLKHSGKIETNAGISYLKEDFSFVRPFTPTPASFNLADSRHYYLVKGQESTIPLVDYAGSANVAFTLGRHQRLTIAAHSRFGTIENEIKTRDPNSGEMLKSDLMEGKQMGAEVSLTDEIAFERWSLSLGGRYQWIRFYDTFYEDTSILEAYESRTDGQFNPKVGVIYKLCETTTLRGSVGRSSNFPTLMSLFGIFEQPPGRERIGNPLLDTEVAVGYEVGAECRPADTITLGVTGFYNDLHGWIESTEARADLPDLDLKENAVIWQNVDRAMTAGVEIEARWRPAKSLGLFANYTYTRTRIDRFDEAGIRYKYFTRTTTHNNEKEGNELSGQPRHSANMGLSCSHPFWGDASATVRYVGERYYDVENTLQLDPFVTVDLKIARSFGRHIKASLTISNLFDEAWQDDDRHRPPGRMIMAGVKLGF